MTQQEITNQANNAGVSGKTLRTIRHAITKAIIKAGITNVHDVSHVANVAARTITKDSVAGYKAAKTLRQRTR